MPQMSIIVPIYNVEQYLRQCLDSVAGQIFSDYECILVDDGSPDNCPSICDEYAENNRRFKVIHKENGGLSDARNVGILAATGEYIAFLDSDDLLADNEALGNLYNVIEKTHCPVIISSNLGTLNEKDDYSIYDGFDKHIDHCESMFFYKTYHGIYLTAWLFVIQKNFLIQHDLFFKNDIYYEDIHFVPRVICSHDIVAVNHNIFYTYRVGRIGSIMSNRTPKHLFYKIMIIDDLLVYSRNKEQQSYKSLIYKNYCVRLWHSILLSILQMNDKYDDTIKQIFRELKKRKYIFLYRGRFTDIIFFILLSVVGMKVGGYILLQYLKLRSKILHFSRKSNDP